MIIKLGTLKEGRNIFIIDKFSSLMEEFDKNLINISPLELQIDKVNEYFYLKGFLDYILGLCCDRCLIEYTQNYNIDIKLAFYRGNIDTDNTQDLIVLKQNQQDLDLFPFLREAIYLNLPYQKLCSEDCKGLCSQCGMNLNEENCNCKNEKTTDPRLQIFANLAKKMK